MMTNDYEQSILKGAEVRWGGFLIQLRYNENKVFICFGYHSVQILKNFNVERCTWW